MSYDEEPKPKVLEFHKNKLVWGVILFSLSGILLHFFPLKLDFNWPSFPSRPVTAPVHPSAAPRQQVIRIELDPERWSDWVQMPDDCNFHFSDPGCHFEVLFPNGTKRSYADDGSHHERDPLPSSRFRIRGTKSTMEISVDSIR